MHGDEQGSPPLGEPLPAYSPALRKVIENPEGSFQKWKRGEISYLQMCGDFTKELALAKMENSFESAKEEQPAPIG